MATENPLVGFGYLYRRKQHPQAPEIKIKAAVVQ